MHTALLVTLEYPPQVGGVAHYYSRLVEHMPAGQITVLTNDNDQLLNRWIWPRWLRGLRTVYKAIRVTPYRWLLAGQILPIGTICWLLSFIRPVQYVVMTHALDVTAPFGPTGNWRKRWLIRHILRRAAAVTTVSQFTARHLQQLGVAPERCYLIPPCPYITPDRFPAAAAVNDYDQQYQLDNRLVLLTVGRLVKRKGHAAVIAVLPTILQRCPQLVYVIVGDGPERLALEKLVADTGLSAAVRFVGQASDQAVADWFRRADAFVLLNQQLDDLDVEGFGIVFVEAASFGLAAIGGNSGGAPDAITAGHTGLLVDPNDTKAVTTAITQLLTDQSMRQNMGAAAAKRVQTDFQWSQRAKAFADILRHPAS